MIWLAIDIEIDGIYCPKCKQMHPTLYWHDKYDSYLNFSLWKETYSISLSRFGKAAIPEVVVKEYENCLRIRDLQLSEKRRQCIICSHETLFVNRETNNAVCSDECQYRDNMQHQEP